MVCAHPSNRPPFFFHFFFSLASSKQWCRRGKRDARCSSPRQPPLWYQSHHLQQYHTGIERLQAWTIWRHQGPIPAVVHCRQTHLWACKSSLSPLCLVLLHSLNPSPPIPTDFFHLFDTQTLWERILRQVVFNWLPTSMQMKQLLKDTAYRPQANFLPQAPKRGTMDTIPQQPSKRLQREKEEEEARNKNVTAL